MLSVFASLLGSMIIIMLVIAMCVFPIYLFNRSRWTLEEAIQRSEWSENELRELIKERLLIYRRKYLISGPLSFDVRELAEAHTAWPEIQRLRAENAATLHRMAENAAAHIAEANRRYQEQFTMRQEERERMNRVYAEILKNMRIQFNLMPPDVLAALDSLGLAHDASFDQVRQQYRLLAKRHHPDTGGDPKVFVSIDAAYKRISTWLQAQSE